MYVGMTMMKKNRDMIIISVNNAYFSHLPAYIHVSATDQRTYVGW